MLGVSSIFCKLTPSVLLSKMVERAFALPFTVNLSWLSCEHIQHVTRASEVKASPGGTVDKNFDQFEISTDILFDNFEKAMR